MQLDPQAFNEFLANWAQAVSWRRADFCPCRSTDTGSPNPACKVCQNGIIWRAAVSATLAISGQKVQDQWARHGMWTKGDVVCTLAEDQPLYDMSENDRVLFMQSSVPFSLPRVNTGPQLMGFVPTKIDRVFWLNEDLTAQVEGKIPDVSDETTELTWSEGGEPPDGTQYTISGRRNPEFFAFMDIAQDRAHHGGKRLPRKIVLRAFDLFGRAP